MQLVGKYAGEIYINQYQLVICESTITLSVDLVGDIRGHTFLWQQLSGSPITFETPANATSVVFQQTAIADDKTFVFWIDYGLPYAIATYILVSSKPTDNAVVGAGTGNIIGVGGTTVALGASTQQPNVSLSPVVTVPTYYGNAVTYNSGVSSWEVVITPPTTLSDLSSYTVRVNNGNGYQPITTLPFQYGSANGQLYRPITANESVIVDANYRSPNTYAVSAASLHATTGIFQGTVSEQASVGAGINSSLYGLTTTFSDYRIIGQNATDAVQSVGANVGIPVTLPYTSTTVSSGTNAGSVTTVVSALSTFVTTDFRIEFNSAATDTVPTVSYGIQKFTPTVTFTVNNASIISLG
jgi:hypothetical protein